VTLPGRSSVLLRPHARRRGAGPAYASSAASRTWCARRHLGPRGQVLLRSAPGPCGVYREWLPLAPDDVPSVREGGTRCCGWRASVEVGFERLW